MIVTIEPAKKEGSIVIHLEEDDEDPIIDEKDWLELGFRIGKIAEGADIDGVRWHEYATSEEDDGETDKESNMLYLDRYTISIEDLTRIMSGQLLAPWLHD